MAKSKVGGAVSGMASGAAQGAAFGPWGAAIGGGIGLISNIFAGDAAEEEAEAAAAESKRQFDMAMQMVEEATQRLESEGVPPIQAREIALEQANLDPSAFEQIDANMDPRLKNAQMDHLAKLTAIGETGMTGEERAQEMMNMRRASAQAQSRDKSIMANMAERGMSGSGSELARRLQSSQSAADRASVEQTMLTGQAQNRALQSIAQAGRLGGQIRSQDYGQARDLASARDRINQFNETNRTGTLNQQEIHNKGLVREEYIDRINKAQAIASAKTGQAQMLQTQSKNTLDAGAARAQGKLDQGSAVTGLVSNITAAGIDKWGADGGVVGDFNDDNTTYSSRHAVGYADGGVTSSYKHGGIHGYEDGGMVLDDIPTEELHKMLEKEKQRYAEGGMVLPDEEDEEETMVQQGPSEQAPNSNGGFAGGGIPIPESGMSEDQRYLEGDVVPGESFEGDRVDAKVNSGEMVINVEQQQRLMDLLKGYIKLKELGQDNIVETPGTVGELGGLSRNPEQPPQEAMPPEGMAPAMPQGPHMMPDGTPMMAEGGMVPSEFKNDHDDNYTSHQAHHQEPTKPRGLTASLDHERKTEEASNTASKERKARIKAYEVIMRGGK